MLYLVWNIIEWTAEWYVGQEDLLATMQENSSTKENRSEIGIRTQWQLAEVRDQ